MFCLTWSCERNADVQRTVAHRAVEVADIKKLYIVQSRIVFLRIGNERNMDIVPTFESVTHAHGEVVHLLL